MSVTVNSFGAVSVTVSNETGVSVIASGGIGPAGFITAPGTATNAFGTFQLEPGVGITMTTTEGRFLIAGWSSSQVAGFSPVLSVAGRTGAVSINAGDVTAGTFDVARLPAIGYTALAGVPTSFSPQPHTHNAADIQAGVLDVARIPAIGYTALSGVPGSFSPSAHTHSTSDIVSFVAAAGAAAPVQSVNGKTGVINLASVDVTAAALSHTHDAGDVVSGTFSLARLPAIPYTALSGAPTSFPPDTSVANVASVNGLTGTLSVVAGANVTVTTSAGSIQVAAGSGLPGQTGTAGVLASDGTNASWQSRYLVVDPVLVQGAGMSLTRDTAAGQITVSFAGGTSGIVVGSATPQPLGIAAAGTSGNASREDHVHALPTASDLSAAAAVHSHDASDVISGVFGVERIPAISFTALSNVPTSFAPDTSVANVVSVNGITGAPQIVGGSGVTVVTSGTAITLSASAAGSPLLSWTTVNITSRADNLYFGGTNGVPDHYDVVRCGASAAQSISGIATGASGRTIRFINTGIHTLQFLHESAFSSSTNRILTATASAVDVEENEHAFLLYDPVDSRWRLVPCCGGSTAVY